MMQEFALASLTVCDAYRSFAAHVR